MTAKFRKNDWALFEGELVLIDSDRQKGITIGGVAGQPRYTIRRKVGDDLSVVEAKLTALPTQPRHALGEKRLDGSQIIDIKWDAGLGKYVYETLRLTAPTHATEYERLDVGGYAIYKNHLVEIDTELFEDGQWRYKVNYGPQGNGIIASITDLQSLPTDCTSLRPNQVVFVRGELHRIQRIYRKGTGEATTWLALGIDRPGQVTEIPLADIHAAKRIPLTYQMAQQCLFRLVIPGEVALRRHDDTSVSSVEEIRWNGGDILLGTRAEQQTEIHLHPIYTFTYLRDTNTL